MPNTKDQRAKPTSPIRQPQSNAQAFRPDIEGLRAIAVLAVVLDHSGLAVHGGYIGVDVFFVISGFLITSHLFNELTRDGRISVARFYARRVRRILPAATVVIIVTLLASWAWVSPLGIHSISFDAITSALFCVNYRLAEVATNYFANHSPSPFQQYWSLAIEEQFYALWPLLLLGVTWSARRLISSRRSVSSFLLLVIAFSLYESITLTNSSPSWAYFSLATRAWELALGGLIAVNAESLSRASRSKAVPSSWIGFGAILAAAFWFNASTPFPGIAVALPVTGAALLIAAGSTTSQGGATTLLALSPLQFVGRISYSWYLWHWPVLILLPLYLGHANTTKDEVFAIALSFLLASASYLLVEQPFRKNQRLVNEPRRGLLLGASLIGTSVIGAGLLMTLVVIPTGVGSTSAPSSITRAVMAGSALRELPANVSPSLAAAPQDGTFNCADGAYDITPLPANTCVFGDVRAKRTVVLFGDSHASMWRAPIAAIAARRGWRLITYVHSGAAFVDSTDLNIVGPTGIYADKWNRAVFQRLAILRPALVIMTGYTVDYFGARTMTETVDKLKRDGARVVWIADTPYPGFIVPDCLAAHINDVQPCNVSTVTGLILPKIRGALSEAATRAGALVINPLPWFCTSTTCPAIIANTIVYWDQDHITKTYALKLTPELSAALAHVMPTILPSPASTSLPAPPSTFRTSTP